MAKEGLRYIVLALLAPLLHALRIIPGIPDLDEPGDGPGRLACARSVEYHQDVLGMAKAIDNALGGRECCEWAED